MDGQDRFPPVIWNEGAFIQNKADSFPESSDNSQEIMAQGVRQNIIYYEMLLDLCYRLRLADDLFCQASHAVMFCMKGALFAEKKEAVALINDYSQALQVIYTDFLHVISGCHLMFPSSLAVWRWNEPDAEEQIMLNLERLHDIADGMEMKLHVSLLEKELGK